EAGNPQSAVEPSVSEVLKWQAESVEHANHQQCAQNAHRPAIVASPEPVTGEEAGNHEARDKCESCSVQHGYLGLQIWFACEAAGSIEPAVFLPRQITKRRTCRAPPLR